MKNTFANAVAYNQPARTANQMKARKSTGSELTDLFFHIGAMRGHDVTSVLQKFYPAYMTDQERALRILQWARDVRGGAGEREIFRKLLNELAGSGEDLVRSLIPKVPEVGRWDDLLVLENTNYWPDALELIRKALNEGNGLCAKWMPRKGELAAKIRKDLGWTPKYYRKRLVELTNVVETLMCEKKWDEINFSHVPSVAHRKYRRAFVRNSDEYKNYLDSLEKGEAKIHAGAVFPHEIVKEAFGRPTGDQKRSIIEQWKALPNYIKDANVLPVVDVSGSMCWSPASVRPIEVSVGLGIYFADKNEGKFKNTFCTFSSRPELQVLRGDLVAKVKQLQSAEWGMSTNLHAVFDKVLDTGVRNNLPQKEMPDTIFILSDMQFNCCTNYDDSAQQMIERKYKKAGYKVPNVVYWNLNSYDNVPVSFNKKGVALVSGFSPAICKMVLEAVELGDLTPEAVMDRTIMSERYDLG